MMWCGTALKIAKLPQLFGLVGENNAGHFLFLAAETQTIRVPDRETELRERCERSFRMPFNLDTNPE
jgi:hypothetical protein